MAKKIKPKKLDPDDWLNGGPIEDDEAHDSLAGVIVTKSRLATLTGLSVATLDRAFAEGAPVVGKGSRKMGWQINTADFFGWYVRKKVEELTEDPDRLNFDQAKAAEKAASARLKEMQLARLERETVTIDEVINAYREEATLIRSQLLAIPGRLAVPVSAESDAVVNEAIIADEINLALSAISGDRLEAWTEETDDDRDRREERERDSSAAG